MAKRRRQMTAQAKRRLIVFGPFCLILMGYLVFTVISYTASLYQLQQKKAKLDTEYLELQEEADELKTEITKLQDPEYLAKFARENYLYSKDGELILKINESNAEENIQEEKTDKNESIVIVSAIAIVLIFLYIIIRSRKKKKS